jgi:hypothetical protein
LSHNGENKMIFPDEKMIASEAIINSKQFDNETDQFWGVYSFKEGAQWAISHIKAQASEGFKEWELVYFGTHENCHHYMSHIKTCWQTSAISRDLHWQKIVDEKDKEIERLKCVVYELEQGEDL